MASDNTFVPTVQAEYTDTKNEVDAVHTEAAMWNSAPPALPELPVIPEEVEA